MKTYPLIINNELIEKENTETIINKYSYENYANVSLADESDANSAVDAARNAVDNIVFDIMTRYNVLSRTAQLMIEKIDELADVLTKETGKTLQDARNEVMWSADLFTESAEEAKRLTGETVCFPVPWLDEQLCYTRREPIGVVVAITPFNYPLNLVSHKVAPALAGGNAVVLKPSQYTPIIAYKLCEILIEAGLPKGYINYISGSGSKIGEVLTSNENVDYYSFTGSVSVGKHIKERIGLRECAMELGSNAATIVCDDYDIDTAVASCADAAFTNAGQVCIHLQRLYVQSNIYNEFVKKYVNAAQSWKTGDPSDPESQSGPMIAEKEAVRVLEWVKEAEVKGAKVLCGNTRENSVVTPTVLINAQPDMKVMCEEVFGPVVSIIPFDNLDEAIDMVNDSRFGLNAGVLTKNISIAKKSIEKINTGSVIIGGTCGFRFGNMPYGGVKESGFGKEGPKYAIRSMTKMKTVVILD